MLNYKQMKTLVSTIEEGFEDPTHIKNGVWDNPRVVVEEEKVLDNLTVVRIHSLYVSVNVSVNVIVVMDENGERVRTYEENIR